MNEHNRLRVGPGLARSWPSSLCVLGKEEKKNRHMKICDFSGIWAMVRVLGFHNRLTSIYLWLFHFMHYLLTVFRALPNCISRPFSFAVLLCFSNFILIVASIKMNEYMSLSVTVNPVQ